MSADLYVRCRTRTTLNACLALPRPLPHQPRLSLRHPHLLLPRRRHLRLLTPLPRQRRLPHLRQLPAPPPRASSRSQARSSCSMAVHSQSLGKFYLWLHRAHTDVCTGVTLTGSVLVDTARRTLHRHSRISRTLGPQLFVHGGFTSRYRQGHVLTVTLVQGIQRSDQPERNLLPVVGEWRSHRQLGCQWLATLR